MRKLFSLLCLFLLAACQPSAPVVVTSAPIVITATPQAPTHTATPVTARCSDRADWDDPVTGCNRTTNAAFTSLAAVDGLTVPRGWTHVRPTPALDVTCTTGQCEYNIAFTRPLSSAGLTQPVTLRAGQCYLAKLILSYRVRGTQTDWPSDNLFVGLNTLDGTNWQAISRGSNRPNPADANFISGATEHVWPVTGEGLYQFTVQLRVQWGVFQAGSAVRLIGAHLFEAPDGFCAGGSVTLEPAP